MPVNALANIIQPKNVLEVNELAVYAISIFRLNVGEFTWGE